jgi:hypothetical protein
MGFEGRKFFSRLSFFKAFLLLFLFVISLGKAFADECEQSYHFAFAVVNSEEERLYWGCYDAVNLGPHIVEYILTRERALSFGVPRPRAIFTQNRDSGVLQGVLREHGFSLPRHALFTRSGFDRGHMAPNADFNDTPENALLTFFIANVWPQRPSVNRGEWLELERQTRRLSAQHLAVRVVIVVDEFTDENVNGIRVPLNFKRTVYAVSSGELVLSATVYQDSE